MGEVNLLENYPKTKRNLEERRESKTEEDRKVARRFGREFFDGDRRFGYGGFSYHPRFWQPVIPAFQQFYQLNSQSRVLDVGCAKGFMLHDFRTVIPGIHVAGVDVSQYAIAQAIDDVKPYVCVANAKELPFEDKSFDLVISINTIHNLSLKHCKEALHELQRVSCGYAFITVDAYRNAEEKERMDMWNLTAQTYMHVDEWIALFKEVGYQGDYYWFIP